jgi:hypothetical protein
VGAEVSNNIALDVEVDGPPSDWTPFKIVGVAQCIDPNGNVDLWFFEDDKLQNWEAIGMLESALCIRREAAPYITFMEADEDDDDD